MMKEDPYFYKRKQLVDGLRFKGITDKAVLDAMMKIPRHSFMDKKLWADPYEDAAQGIGSGQTISQPYIVALMSQELRLHGHEKVLELGTGSGYQTAVLCELAKEVYSIERIEELYEKAQYNLSETGYTNFHLKLDDGTLGWENEAPFDAIIVTATAPEVPLPLKEQLKEGGRMVIPVGKGSPQELIVVTRHKEGFIEEFICSVYFVPLIGVHAWKR
jgi:protein-L-isoaspartate(D-aspartate) O-methyltransferase